MTTIMNLSTWLNIAYLLILTAITIASIVSFRVSMDKTRREIERNTMEVMERANNALMAEINTLKDKISDLERENIALKQTLGLIKSALRKRGLVISIDGDLVTIASVSGDGITHSGHIQAQGS